MKLQLGLLVFGLLLPTTSFAQFHIYIDHENSVGDDGYFDGSFDFEDLSNFKGKNYQPIFDSAISFWNNAITGHQTIDTTYELRVFGGMASLSDALVPDSTDILGGAYMDSYIQTSDGFFYSVEGALVINSDAVPSLSDDQLHSTIVHELGHVIGYEAILWEEYNLYDSVADPGKFYGENATSQFNAEFQNSLDYVPVETQGGDAAAHNHWADNTWFSSANGLFFYEDVMTGYGDETSYMSLTSLLVSGKFS